MLSILVPVFNGEEFIENLISDLIELNHRIGAELIVINDGSTDSSGDFLKEYLDDIRYIETENYGESIAVNRALSEANLEFALVLSVDDPVPNTEYLISAVKQLQSDKTLVAVCTDWLCVNKSNDILFEVQVPIFNRDLMIANFKCYPGPGTVFRVESAKMIHGRNSNLKYLGDFDFWIRLSELGQFKVEKGFNAYWRKHGSSTSVAGNRLEMVQERIAYLKKLSQDFHLTRKLRKLSEFNCLLSCALILVPKFPIIAFTYLLRAFLKSPKHFLLIVLLRISSFWSIQRFIRISQK